jgi:hypothetical protein
MKFGEKQLITSDQFENGYAATRTNGYNTRVPILNLHKKMLSNTRDSVNPKIGVVE